MNNSSYKDKKFYYPLWLNNKTFPSSSYSTLKTSANSYRRKMLNRKRKKWMGTYCSSRIMVFQPRNNDFNWRIKSYVWKTKRWNRSLWTIMTHPRSSKTSTRHSSPSTGSSRTFSNKNTNPFLLRESHPSRNKCRCQTPFNKVISLTLCSTTSDKTCHPSTSPTTSRLTVSLIAIPNITRAKNSMKLTTTRSISSTRMPLWITPRFPPTLIGAQIPPA